MSIKSDSTTEEMCPILAINKA